MNKKLLLLVCFSLFTIFFLTAASCGTTGSSTQAKSEIPFIQISKVTNASTANYNELTDLFGPNEAIGDNKYPNIPEIDIVKVMAADDNENIRFDIYHASPITLKDDVFYGFAQFWSDGYDVYYYFPLTQELYLNLYDNKDKLLKSINVDLEKSKSILVPWSLAQKNPVNVVSFIFNKQIHWGIKPGSPSTLLLQFVAGYYLKDKGIYYSDITPAIKIEFNY